MNPAAEASSPADGPLGASIVFEGVTVRYGRRNALESFCHVVEPGEWLCLIGPNGAGKSSALRAATGLVEHLGRITVGGTSLNELSPRHRATMVAAVPQLPVLPDDMTGFDYVLLGRTPYISYFGSESEQDHQLVGDLLGHLDLGSFADRPLGTLSGGERQQLVIARALAQQAPVLLLDEPTSALDIGHQQQALELVDRLRREQGLTVVSAMHDLTLAGLYADRLALLDHGRLVMSGTAAEVLTPETLREYYGVAVHVRHEDDGTVVVIPRRA